MPGRRTLTVPNPDDFEVVAEEEVCRLCEGVGALAKDFAVGSGGTPTVIECPHCDATGRGQRVVRISFLKAETALAITMREDDFVLFMGCATGVVEQLAEGEE